MAYAARMKELVDAFWRAAAYCLHPKVILLSLLPLLFTVAAVLGLGWLYWETAVASVRATLEQWALLVSFLHWLESIGAAGFGAVLAPLIVVAVMVPLIIIASLLLVAWLMTPAVVDLVALRRFETLQRKRGSGWVRGALWSLGYMLWALLLLVLSLPLWFVPPLVLVLPPLIWGWLTYKVMSYDVLAVHASTGERRQVMREQHWPLLAIGIITGYLGAAPSLLWAVSAATLAWSSTCAMVSARPSDSPAAMKSSSVRPACGSNVSASTSSRSMRSTRKLRNPCRSSHHAMCDQQFPQKKRPSGCTRRSLGVPSVCASENHLLTLGIHPTPLDAVVPGWLAGRQQRGRDENTNILGKVNYFLVADGHNQLHQTVS